MIALTLLLLSQTYTLDPEPIMQVHESWLEDVERNWVDPTLGTGETVGQRIDLHAATNPTTGEVLATGYWNEGSYGWDNPGIPITPIEPPIQPVIAIEYDGKLYFMWDEQTHGSWFYVNWLGCKSCWKVLAIDSKFESQFRQALYDCGRRGWLGNDWDYDTLVEYHDSWDRKVLSLRDLDRLKVGDDRFRAPWMLRYVRGYVDSKQTNQVVDVPTWAKLLLGNNQRWIHAARRYVGDVGLAVFKAKHGYIPGDRTPLDMQYNFKLRGTIDFAETLRRITYGTRCEPEFGPRGFGVGGRYTQCAELLWNEEQDAKQRERSGIEQLVEQYLEGK